MHILMGNFLPLFGNSRALFFRFKRGYNFPKLLVVKKIGLAPVNYRREDYITMKDKVATFTRFEEDEAEPRINFKETIAYDENGQVLYDVVRKPFKANGSGFVISYTEKMCDFLAKYTAGSVVRTFLFLAHHQQYGADGVQFGYRCSHKYLQQVLGLDRKSVFNALAVLKGDYLVNEARIEGAIEFMVNPFYVTVGTDRKARISEWNRRWQEHWKKANAQ